MIGPDAVRRMAGQPGSRPPAVEKVVYTEACLDSVRGRGGCTRLVHAGRKGPSMRVALDTDVLLSALAFPGGKPDQVRQRARRGEVTLFLPFILAEFERILPDKFRFTKRRRTSGCSFSGAWQPSSSRRNGSSW